MNFKKILVAILAVSVAVALVIVTQGTLFTMEKSPVKFTGKEDHAITLAEASHLTLNYRNQAPPDQAYAEFFGKDAIAGILQQEGCVGLRIYYGQNDDGQLHLVLVGVNANGDDLTDGKLAERGFICPPLCSKANPLNSPEEFQQLSFNR